MINQTRRISGILAIGSLALLAACTGPGSGGHHARVTVISKQALAPSMVQQVQVRLQQRGIYNGNVDGVWGPATEAAVHAYQTSMGMIATGQLDTQTIAALNLAGPENPPTQADLPPTPSQNIR